MVTRRLRERFLPSMKVIDFSWNVNAKVVRFFAQSTKMHELFEELFDTTFGLELVLDGAYTAAEYGGFNDAELDAIALSIRLPSTSIRT